MESSPGKEEGSTDPTVRQHQLEIDFRIAIELLEFSCPESSTEWLSHVKKDHKGVLAGTDSPIEAYIGMAREWQKRFRKLENEFIETCNKGDAQIRELEELVANRRDRVTKLTLCEGELLKKVDAYREALANQAAVPELAASTIRELEGIDERRPNAEGPGPKQGPRAA